MRIALVVYGSLDVLSGGNLYDRRLVEHLRVRGHHVDVIELAPGGYPRHVLQNFSSELRERLWRGAYDLVLQDELAHPSLFWLNQVVRPRVSSPFVAVVHHLLSSEERAEWKNELYRGFEKTFLASVDAFVFNSQTTRTTVEALVGGEIRHVVAPPGGDRFRARPTPADLRERARRNGAVRLLSVGNLIPRKGYHHLLAALGGLERDAWRLDVVGSLDMDEAYATRLRDRLADLGVEDRVTLHGRLDGDSLGSLYRDSQIFVLPSSYEGFGIVYLEAMSFGLPCIAGASGAAGEVVHHESTGFLVDPSDGRSLRSRIERLIEDRDLLARMSVAARQAFTNHATWEDSMNRIEAFLVEVAGRANPRNFIGDET